MRGFVFIHLLMENELTMPECAYQYFFSDTLPEEKLYEVIGLASIYSENFGPVIMICTESGYDFLAKHMLDDIYIDVIICQDVSMAEMVLDNLKDQMNVPSHLFINSHQNCEENLRILYGKNQIAPEVLQKIKNAVEAEQLKNLI